MYLSTTNDLYCCNGSFSIDSYSNQYLENGRGQFAIIQSGRFNPFLLSYCQQQSCRTQNILDCRDLPPPPPHHPPMRHDCPHKAI